MVLLLLVDGAGTAAAARQPFCLLQRMSIKLVVPLHLLPSVRVVINRAGNSVRKRNSINILSIAVQINGKRALLLLTYY